MFGNTFNPSGGGNNESLFPLATFINLNPITLTNQSPYAGTFYNQVEIKRFSCFLLTLGAAHDAANYYTIRIVFRSPITGSDTQIASFTTNPLPSSAFGKVFSVNTFSPSLLTGGGGVFVQFIKTGLPGDTYIYCPELICVRS